jgi:putative oxidoreductase
MERIYLFISPDRLGHIRISGRVIDYYCRAVCQSFRVARTCRSILAVGRAAVSPHRRRLGIHVERLGGKLQNLPAIIDNFAGWKIPAPHLLAPFVSGVEFFGGIFLLLGLITRISAGALGVTMIVAIISAKWDQVDSLKTLLGFDETECLALFAWLAIAGPGRVYSDFIVEEMTQKECDAAKARQK